MFNLSLGLLQQIQVYIGDWEGGGKNGAEVVDMFCFFFFLGGGALSLIEFCSSPGLLVFAGVFCFCHFRFS